MESEKDRSVPRARILVVDDSSLVRLYFRTSLEKGGFEVEQAINGIEAMEKILAQAFDLVDRRRQHAEHGRFFFYPGLRAARERWRPSGTRHHHGSGPQDREDARTAGANFYLVKPVSEADLLRYAAVLAGVPA